MKIQQLTENLTVFQSELYQTNSTLVQTNDLILLVDPTWLPDEIKTIQVEVNRIQQGKPLYLLFTHSDFDHILGYSAFPGAKTISHHFLQHCSEEYKQDKKYKIVDFYEKYYIKSPFSAEFPHIDYAIQEDNQTIQVGETTLRFFLAPGHTEDGLFCLIDPLGIWVAGDYLSDIEMPFIFDTYQSYVHTMEKAEQLYVDYRMNWLIPGHGSVTDDQTEMKRRIHISKTYLALLRQAIIDDKWDELNQELKRYPFPKLIKETQSHFLEKVTTEIRTQNDSK
ncbi:MBL fold metallo-hydrolase [Hazenella sp. IB182357]|uniref:MBL fold metallo-hydrolase n=1 Tax=Polycladospora coralii TaxID=2771432 RepID=A0A926N607_9BACL|nr:MBL fold metallo-hydrolase [Polycladospora coralii]MBD1371456.1 MBL fold metallo-hydrolase [Polycladospora coralii]